MSISISTLGMLWKKPGKIIYAKSIEIDAKDTAKIDVDMKEPAIVSADTIVETIGIEIAVPETHIEEEG